ncbi:hypothetical protein LCGC14_1783670 [marine sediment metagenome]|uniref:Uncharacterized protein n=1 Tax=marine sediment metagenome TaxID=412755 RepID=A0A0F9JU94_9ZZZZ
MYKKSPCIDCGKPAHLQLRDAIAVLERANLTRIIKNLKCLKKKSIKDN